MSSTERTIVVQSATNWLNQTETWLHEQVSRLPDDIESHVVCEHALHLEQFPVRHLHAFSDLPWWRRLRDSAARRLGVRNHLGFLVDQLRHSGARILHSHFGDRGWCDRGAVRDSGVKHVVTFYGLDVNFLPSEDPRWRTRYLELFDGVDRVLCEGVHMARCIVQLGCPAEKVVVHALGVRVDEIPFVPRTWNSGQPLRVLIAAGFREKKGIPYALEALAELRQNVPVEITIIGDAHGGGRSQREKQRILAVIEERGLGPHTRRLGFIPHREMLAESYRHHVFLSPSVTASDGDSEGGAPVSIIEMCAAGIPVVSTTHCDIPGVIRNGETGLLAEERDVPGLVRHLRWLIENPEAWDGMVRASRKHIEAEFHSGIQARRLAAIYRGLIDRAN